MKRTLRFRLAVGLILLSGSAGCQVSRTMFQMDSNNQAPSIGLDLAPKVKSDSVHPIVERDTGSSGAEVQTTGFEQSPGERKWLKWLNPLSRPKHIPLPRTDLAEQEDLVAVEGEAVDVISDDF